MVAQNNNHESYKNLIGGNTNGHYHLTKSQYQKLRGLIGLPVGNPPVITYGQVINIEAGLAMTPYTVQGTNVRP